MMHKKTWFGICLGLAALAAPTTLAWAAGLPVGPPVRVDAGINVRFNVYAGPAANQAFGGALAPWYAYFPADAHLQAVAARAAYPTWPQQWPPSGGIPNAGQPNHSNPGNPFGAPSPAFHPPTVRPVGHWAPSYWYGR